MKRLVDACHARGLGVVLDVVYNHLGPAGNHLAEFGPYFADRHPTNWGPALNVDGPGSDEVRAFVVDNARMWLRDYHVDGLRLDAVHAIVDQSATHVLEQLAASVRELAGEVGRPLWLIAESDLNAPRFVRPPDRGGYGLDAAWADEWHHALHAALTGEADGYYGTSARSPCWPRRSARPGSTTGPTRRTATGSTAARRWGCTAPSSWWPPRTTTRSATGPAASGSASWCRRAGCASPPPCC